MIDETNPNQPAPDAPAGYQAPAPDAAGWTQHAPYTATPTNPAGSLPPAPTHIPNPGAAFFLGLIPGVGAIYNGQYAKGLIHVVIFLALALFSKDVNGIFGFFNFIWVIYMAFEAHHTARAMQLGQPLPNAFGFNDLGDRMGFGRNWPGSATRPAQYPPVTQWTPVTPPMTGAPGGPVAPAPDWVGYVPPTNFAQAPPAVDPNVAYAQAMRDAGYGSGAGTGTAPYAETYTGGVSPVAGASAATPVVSGSRFPVSALVLIGLGVLFLLQNWMGLHFNKNWIVVVVLAGASLWSLMHRFRILGGSGQALAEGNRQRLICSLRWPVILGVLAVMFALQASYVATIGQTWPLILVAVGAMLLLERTAGSSPMYVPPTSAPVVEAPSGDASGPSAEKGGL